MNNTSSVEYNILSPQEKNNIAGAVIMKILDKKIAAKKKGVAEFSDLTRPFNPNFFPIYTNSFNENNNIFMKYNGVFSHLYDSAHKNGDLVVPFRNEKDKNKVNKDIEKRKSKINDLKMKFEIKNRPPPFLAIESTSNMNTQQNINIESNVINIPIINNTLVINNDSKKINVINPPVSNINAVKINK